MLITGVTFNVKFPERRGNGQDWGDRRELLAEALRVADADVVGTQEGHGGQLREIVADSGRYWQVGGGREGGGRGEYCAVLYDPARLTVVESGDFWLSETPEVVGSRSEAWENRVVRMATWARFARDDGGELVWLNTHLDHKAEPARRLGAELIVRRLARFGTDMPVVVSGDFNCGPDSAAYRTLTGAGGLTDAWRAVGRAEHGTYGGWAAPTADTDRIDWILYRGPVLAESAELVLTHDGDRWPSDHVPVRVTLRLGG